MAWSKWYEHDGSGYPAPLGSRALVENYFGSVLEGIIGSSGKPENLSSWTWRVVDGTPTCYQNRIPFLRYRLWNDKATDAQVAKLKNMIKYEKIEKLIQNQPEEIDS